jgi:Raf kinase inhibitor-like YbhB/YbcL family protein
MTLRLLAPAVALLVSCGGGSGPDTVGLVEEDTMELTSVFEDQEPIPTRYSCDGEGISPPVQIAGIPEGTVTLALIMDDPDAPAGTFDHWVAFDIPPTGEIPEDVGDLGTAGRNSGRRLGYTPPCPPSGTHRYVFRVYALDTELGRPEGATKGEVLAAAEGHVVGQGTLIGTYSR